MLRHLLLISAEQTYLHNLLTLRFGCTNYRLMANELPSLDGSPSRNVAVVMIHDEIMADGEASSGKNAKVKASQAALEQLRDIAPFEFRMQYRCNCQAGGEKSKDAPGEAVGSAI